MALERLGRGKANLPQKLIRRVRLGLRESLLYRGGESPTETEAFDMSFTDDSEAGCRGRDLNSASSSETRWYLVHTKPREDERALEHLQRQDYECYRPVRHHERLRHGRKALISESLFPRYLFIHLSSVDDNWYPIRSTRGVQQLVTCNQKPVPVRDQIIEGIRIRLGEVAPEPLLRAGERVVITEAPFNQLEAIFVASDGDERVVLLLNILQQDHRMIFPLSSVRKLA